MRADTTVKARIPAETKERAVATLDRIGLSVSDIIRLTLMRVADEGRVPFDLEVPNKLTAETLAKSERGEDLHRFDSAEALFKDLGI